MLLKKNKQYFAAVFLGAYTSGLLAGYYNLPVIIWGATFDSMFINTTLFPTIIGAVPNHKEFILLHIT